jgi:hypothetical protein
MIKALIVCYIIIIILQFIITNFTSPNISDAQIALQKKIKYNIEHKDELIKIFKKRVLEIAKPINSGEMEFDEWIIWMNNLPALEFDGNKYYFTVWETIIEENGNKDFVLLHYGDPNYVGLNYTDFRNEMNEIVINSKYSITEDSSNYSSAIEGSGETDGYVYYWVDPLSLQSVKKQNVNTLFSDKHGKNGYISIGIDLEDLSEKYSYKYYKHLRPITLIVSSIITISVAIIINNLDTMKYSNIRALAFLLASNMYILLFMNTYETESTPENEILKMERITGAILTFSFLSGVNIYILKSLFENKKNYFKESAFIFGISIILILMSAYKYDNPDDIKSLLLQRISSQLTFNLAVILNSLILVNFMFFTLSLKNILK